MEDWLNRIWSDLIGRIQAFRLLGEGKAAVARVLLLGVVMDVLYQLIVFRWIYPLEIVIVVLLVAFVPYLLARGPINHIARLISGTNAKRTV